MNTTKRHPRSTMEAFPRTAEYGAAIEVPRKYGIADTLKGAALAVFLGVLLAAVFVGELVK